MGPISPFLSSDGVGEDEIIRFQKQRNGRAHEGSFDERRTTLVCIILQCWSFYAGNHLTAVGFSLRFSTTVYPVRNE